MVYGFKHAQIYAIIYTDTYVYVCQQRYDNVECRRSRFDSCEADHDRPSINPTPTGFGIQTY